MREMMSPCGMFCPVCRFYVKGCAGCLACEGRSGFQQQYYGTGQCPIYHCCVEDRQLEHCGHCGELPCALYYDREDPTMNEKMSRTIVKERAAVLRKQRKLDKINDKEPQHM